MRIKKKIDVEIEIDEDNHSCCGKSCTHQIKMLGDDIFCKQFKELLCKSNFHKKVRLIKCIETFGMGEE